MGSHAGAWEPDFFHHFRILKNTRTCKPKRCNMGRYAFFQFNPICGNDGIRHDNTPLYLFDKMATARLFFCRPDLVRLSAIGFSSPKPTASIR